ncbi:hypothetical protein Tco_0946600, partial [Tanacetum coccineum]
MVGGGWGLEDEVAEKVDGVRGCLNGRVVPGCAINFRRGAWWKRHGGVKVVRKGWESGRLGLRSRQEDKPGNGGCGEGVGIVGGANDWLVDEWGTMPVVSRIVEGENRVRTPRRAGGVGRARYTGETVAEDRGAGERRRSRRLRGRKGDGLGPGTWVREWRGVGRKEGRGTGGCGAGGGKSAGAGRGSPESGGVEAVVRGEWAGKESSNTEGKESEYEPWDRTRESGRCLVVGAVDDGESGGGRCLKQEVWGLEGGTEGREEAGEAGDKEGRRWRARAKGDRRGGEELRVGGAGSVAGDGGTEARRAGGGSGSGGMEGLKGEPVSSSSIPADYVPAGHVLISA